MNEWISVKEKMPDKSGYYLIACNNPYRGRQNGVDVSYYQHKVQNWKATYNPDVTHWMSLPEPPKEMTPPQGCYEQYGSDLDSCSRQEMGGCKGCACLVSKGDSK